MLDSLISKLFHFQEDVTIEGDIPGLYECSLYNLPKFCGGQCTDHYMRILQFRIRSSATRCSSREGRAFCDPRVAMVYLSTLYRLQSIVDTCSANSIFAERCGHFFLSPIVPTNQLLSLHIWVPTGSSTISSLGPRRVSRMIFSFASSASLYCTLRFPNEGEGRVFTCPKTHLSRALCICLLTAPCRTLLEFDSNLRRVLAYSF